MLWSRRSSAECKGSCCFIVDTFFNCSSTTTVSLKRAGRQTQSSCSLVLSCSSALSQAPKLLRPLQVSSRPQRIKLCRSRSRGRRRSFAVCQIPTQLPAPSATTQPCRGHIIITSKRLRAPPTTSCSRHSSSTRPTPSPRSSARAHMAA